LNKSKIISVLIIVIVLFLNIYIPISYTAQGKRYDLTPDINSIDDTLYPGYKNQIKALQAAHPNYRVLVYYTGLSWNEVLTAEFQGHGYSPINLFQIGPNYNGKWICPICGNKAYDNGSWCCASMDALAYMMDPRNSINESDIFQFKDLEGSDVQYADIQRVVANYGSYINNPEAIQAIVDASIMYNINGYFLVAKIINEHGKNGSTLCLGRGYNGNYVGCYNYFNIGSFGNGSATIINNGLSYALSHGWTSIRASIIGGAQVVKDSYITRYSQNTLYYQKFNVSGKALLNSHQYQQNIMAAQSQGASLKRYYEGTSTPAQYTFIIPIFEGMPASPCARPSTSIPNTLTYENGVVKNISTSLKVRASAGGTAIGALNNEESIKIIQRASNEISGYYWDLIVSNKDGTYGYAARRIGGDDCIVSVGSTGNNSTTTSPEPNTNTPAQPNNNSTPPVQPNTNSVSYVIDEANVRVKVIPSYTVEDVIKNFSGCKVTEKAGALKLNGGLATGDTIEYNGKFYKVVKKGDVNGDSQVNIFDAIKMLNTIKAGTPLESYEIDAGCIKGESNFTVSDVIVLLNYIKGVAQIGL